MHTIFEPFLLHQHRLKNRLAVTPMSRVSATEQGVPATDMEDYYEAFARGGFSLIITEGVYTDLLASRSYQHQPGIVTPEQVNGWRRIVRKVQSHGALLICQLMHAGALSQHLAHTWGPSAVQPPGRKMPEYGGEGAFPLPKEMTLEEIALVKQGFINAALLAYTAGFDGVELHAANGYLLDQFMTGYTNLRSDSYGGTVANRFRLIAEIIDGIRKVVPAGFLTGLRLSEGKVNDLRYRWPEGAAMARAVLAEAAKVRPDYIHIAAETGNWERECLYEDGTSFPGLAKQMTGAPVIANGGLHDPALSGKVLSEGHADLIALGRAAIACPEWPLLMEQGVAPRAFHPGMIKPSATLAHTKRVIGEGMPC